MSQELPQIFMRRALDRLPALVVPDGYVLRVHTADDRAVWSTLLDENGGFGPWPIERSAPLFDPGSPVIFPGSFFLTRDGEPIATAQLHHQTRRDWAPAAELSWVAVSPRHQGRGLAYVVCLAVMSNAASAGYRDIFLRTEDHRLAAIRTYLKLGFEPWQFDASHPERWSTINRLLDEHARSRDQAEWRRGVFVRLRTCAEEAPS